MISVVITSSNYTEWQIQAEWNLKPPSGFDQISTAHPPLCHTSAASTYWLWGRGCEITTQRSKISVYYRLLSFRWKREGGYKQVGQKRTYLRPTLTFSLLLQHQHLMSSDQITLMSWRVSVNADVSVRGMKPERCRWSGGSNVKCGQYLASYSGDQYLWNLREKIVKDFSPRNLSFFSIASVVICDICTDVKTWTENGNDGLHTQTRSRFVTFIGKSVVSDCRFYDVCDGPSLKVHCIFLTGVLYVKTE